jgi:hypothetical protein
VLAFAQLDLFTERNRLRSLDKSARALGELFHIHERPRYERPALTAIAAGQHGMMMFV